MRSSRRSSRPPPRLGSAAPPRIPGTPIPMRPRALRHPVPTRHSRCRPSMPRRTALQRRVITPVPQPNTSMCWR
ncbi:hypothetical protein BW14_10285 [Bifidobacterium sp. UTBIF-68]|nr:hypothetical protein BW14_10285 [Bifidobacterium sp. UTBIF-68]